MGREILWKAWIGILQDVILYSTSFIPTFLLCFNLPCADCLILYGGYWVSLNVQVAALADTHLTIQMTTKHSISQKQHVEFCKHLSDLSIVKAAQSRGHDRFSSGPVCLFGKKNKTKKNRGDRNLECSHYSEFIFMSCIFFSASDLIKSLPVSWFASTSWDRSIWRRANWVHAPFLTY